MTASSPACQPVTPSPTASTTPAPSEPGMHGGCTSRWTTYRSRWLSAAAFRRMTICAGPGARSGRSASASAVRGLRAASCRARIQESFRRVKRRKAKGESKSRRHSERGAGTTGCSITAPTGAFQRWRGVMLYCSKGSQARSSSMTDLMGRTIGQYQLLDEIGRGGMATVYRAHQLNIDREVALKILPAQLAHDPTFLARFEREVQIAARVQHPRILPVFDVGEYNGQPYLVMAYMPGGTLEGWIQQSEGRGLPVDEALRIVSQVAEGLDALHAQGIVHRDLKPSNILLDEHGDCFLSDFGVAQLLETTAHLTGTGLVGTPGYMAPEAFQHGQTSAASDLYALGIIAWEMLAGRHPFEAETPAQWMRAHIEKSVPDIRRYCPDLPPDVNTVLQAATAKVPAYRFSSARQMAAALAQAARARPRPRRRPARRPAWLWAVIGAGLVGVLALGLVGGLLLLGGSKAGAEPTLTPTQPPTAAPVTSGPTTTSSLSPGDTPTAAATSVSMPTLGGGTGWIGFNANGLGYLLDADCVVYQRPGCDANPRILPEIEGVTPNFGSWSPDGRRIAFLADPDLRQRAQGGVLEYSKAPIYIADLESNRLIPVADNGLITRQRWAIVPYNPVWSPDGAKLAFALGPDELYTITDQWGNVSQFSYTNIFTVEVACLESGNSCLQPITQDRFFNDMPRWSPDGSLIAFERERRPYGSQTWSEIVIADATTGTPTTYLGTQQIFNYAYGAEWLDESRLLYQQVFVPREADLQSQMMVDSTAYGDEALRIGGSYTTFQMALSPDRRYLAISSEQAIYLMDLTCLQADPATCNSFSLNIQGSYVGGLAWSPDGKWLAYIRAQSVSEAQDAYGTTWAHVGQSADLYIVEIERVLEGDSKVPVRLTTFGLVDMAGGYHFTFPTGLPHGTMPPQWQPAPQP